MSIFRAATRFERALGHKFSDGNLLRQALTHRSFANERGERGHYERLEYLGDAVLGLVAAEWLYARFPEESEGELSRRKAWMVSARVLHRRAKDLGLGELLNLGVGEDRSGGRDKINLLADSLEAVLGAVYLDDGLKRARAVIVPMLERSLEEREVAVFDSKTQLQELVQARGGELPSYRLVATDGPEHSKRFTIECWIGGRLMGTGEGESKKLAEQRAAASALAGARTEPAAGLAVSTAS
jgi:ribonuclease-3